MEIQQKLERVQRFEVSFREKRDKDWDTYQAAKTRASDLFWDIKCWSRQQFGDSRVFPWEYETFKKYRDERKAKKRQEWETRFRFGTWFMQTSLGSDYGEYSCDKCGRTFYHSPCTIYLAKEKIHNCACGHCANYYAGRNGDKEIYY